MPAQMSSRATGATIAVRLTLLIGLLLAQALTISLAYDIKPLIDSGRAGGFWWLGFGGNAARVAAVFAVAFVLALGPRLTTHYHRYLEAAEGHRWLRRLLLQMLTFVGFVALTHLLLGPGSGAAVPGWLAPLWLAMLIAVAVLWFATLAPLAFWSDLVRAEPLTIVMAALVALAAWAVGLASQQLWSPLAGATFQVSAWGLELIYDPVIADPARFLLGTEDFQVLIGAACSGYEGMGLVLIFTSMYLSVFRSEFRFPQALLLFPIGLATIWLFNAARIVTLITIGDAVSPEIAVEGFHSQAGWISFVCVIAGLLLAAHRVPYFTRQRAPHGSRLNSSVAMLLPLVILLASTLLTSALSATVDWLYPLRVVAVGAALLILWRWFDLGSLRPSAGAIAVGAGVFVLWLVLVPADAARDAEVSAVLAGVSPALIVVWAVFRVAGAALTVPLAEELAFRGYLMSRLAGRPADSERLPFSWLSLLVPALLFGLMHSAWVAGILAGLAYGMLRFRGRGLADAIVAHAATNLLLSIYVLATGTWSLW